MNPFIIIYASIFVCEIILPGSVNCVLVAKHVVQHWTCVSCCFSDISLLDTYPNCCCLSWLIYPKFLRLCCPLAWYSPCLVDDEPILSDMCLSLPCFHMFIYLCETSLAHALVAETVLSGIYPGFVLLHNIFHTCSSFPYLIVGYNMFFFKPQSLARHIQPNEVLSYHRYGMIWVWPKPPPEDYLHFLSFSNGKILVDPSFLDNPVRMLVINIDYNIDVISHCIPVCYKMVPFPFFSS